MEIRSDFFLPSVQETKPQSKPGGLFDQDTFLKLLVAQLQNPSPFEPPDVDQMLNQSVQYGIIERLLQLEQQMEVMNRSVYMARAAELIGREVVVAHGSELVTGIVDRVVFTELGANVVIGSGQYDINAVMEVKSSAPAQPEREVKSEEEADVETGDDIGE